MTRQIFSISLLALALGATAQEKEEKQINRGFGNIGLVYPVSTTGINAPNCRNYFSANAIGGISYDELAFCGAGVANIVRHDAKGLIAAGFSNHIGNEAAGLQAAGFANTVKRHAKGIQAAGFFNYSGSMKGAQFAGFANVTTGEVEGIQGAGFGNIASDADVQLSGFINRACNANTQGAGFINVAHNVKGCQLSGFINVAEKVEGVQVAGFINIADSCDYPIGLINIVRKGEMTLGVTVDEGLTTMVSFRSGGKKLYGIIGVGANIQQSMTAYDDGFWPFYALEGGLGAHFNFGKNFRVNLEGIATSLSDFYVGYYLRTSLRVLPSVTIGEHTEIFAGITFNVEESNIYGSYGLSNNYIWGTDIFNGRSSFYIGAMAGLAYKF